MGTTSSTTNSPVVASSPLETASPTISTASPTVSTGSPTRLTKSPHVSSNLTDNSKAKEAASTHPPNPTSTNSQTSKDTGMLEYVGICDSIRIVMLYYGRKKYPDPLSFITFIRKSI